MASARTVNQWQKTLEDLVEGKRNPRALAVETLKRMKTSVGWLSRRWAISMSTTDVIVDDETGRRNHTWRKRRPDELPENDPAEWDRLIEQARSLELTARELANFGYRQKAAAEQRLIDGGA